MADYITGKKRNRNVSDARPTPPSVSVRVQCVCVCVCTPAPRLHICSSGSHIEQVSCRDTARGLLALSLWSALHPLSCQSAAGEQ